MSLLLQAVPDNGFIIHAVLADSRRAGFREQYTYGKVLCRKIRGRDSQGLASLRLQLADYQDPASAKPFSRNPEDFDISYGARRICSDCAKRATDLEEASHEQA